MKNQLIFILLISLISYPIFSQQYIITEKKGKYGIIDKKGNIILPKKYAMIRECEYASGFFIAKTKKGQYYLLNASSRSFLGIDEQEEVLQIDDKCYLEKGTIIRFRIKNNTGLLTFPDSVILEASYENIFPLRAFKNVFLLKNKKEFKILNLKSDYMSDWFIPLHIYEEFYIDDGYSYFESDEFIIGEFDGTYKMVSFKGEEYLLPKTNESDEYYLEESDLFLAYKDGKYGYVDLYGEVIIPFQYEDAGPRSFNSDMMYIKKGDKYCYIDSRGEIVLPCIYDKAESFIDEYASVSIDGKEFKINDSGEREDWLDPVPKDEEYDTDTPKWGYINTDGEAVIDYIYEDAKMFNYGFAPVKKDGKWGYISQVGSVLIDFQFEEAENFYNGLARCKKGGKWGFIDYKGNFVIENLYDYAGTFTYYANLARVGKKIEGTMKYGCIDKEGNLVLDYTYDDINLDSRDLFSAKLRGKWGFIDRKGKTVIEFKYDDVKDISNGKLPVKLNEKWAFIDKEGKQITEFKYDDVKKFKYGRAPVKIGGQWGYINDKGEISIEVQFDEAGIFYYNTARVKKDGKSFSINKEGNIVK